ncbi:dicarboxylate/amino acid:cation symporter [Propioniciclava sp. MC1595]|uniref:dicarboxylate/amino acid:cation symporter n=1 Tax=Propioniciclava sp. MC1595 TaxID=2760308 RepID=UPI0021AD63C5|nr:dicarboxylate/amino acid:cation symporter [Propioniciclava sp. MC1595]
MSTWPPPASPLRGTGRDCPDGLIVRRLGFTDPMVGLMIATYIAIDSFGTATNVTGDAAIAMVVDKLSAGKIAERPTAALDGIPG